MSRFFIDRPIFAWVIAIVLMLAGVIAIRSLPVAQFPEIAPPTVTITATYPGASAATLSEEVAEPIEEQINGVEDMLYMSSQSTGDGRMQITVTFKLGTSLDKAQVLVQNRVAIALPRLPQEVQRLGVVTNKTSPDFLLVVNLMARAERPHVIVPEKPKKVLDKVYTLALIEEVCTVACVTRIMDERRFVSNSNLGNLIQVDVDMSNQHCAFHTKNGSKLVSN